MYVIKNYVINVLLHVAMYACMHGICCIVAQIYVAMYF